MQFLPKIIKVGLVGVAIVIIAFVFFAYQPSDTSKSKQSETGEIMVVDQNQIFKNVAGVAFSDIDTDGDGLRDWEESLWKTDSQNPDSDGDGTTDGEEVNMGRSPTVSAPDDQLKTSQEENDMEGETSLTVTEAYARQLFTDYLTLKKSGQLYEPFAQDIFFQNLNGAIPQTQGGNHASEDFVIVENSPQSLRKFGNEMGRIFETYWTPRDKSAYEIINSAIVLGNEKEIVQLDPIITNYREVIDQLLSVPVPNQSVDYYLNIVNGLELAHSSLINMRNVFTDPLPAIPSLESYEGAADNIIKNLRLLATDFGLESVVFEKEEKGYALTHLPF